MSFEVIQDEPPRTTAANRLNVLRFRLRSKVPGKTASLV